MLWFTAFFAAISYLNGASYELIEDENTLQILSPSLKNRKTVKLRLENGLEAYIISDPETNQSAAALSVEAGSYDDPEEYPGMAHFCEHMLFMGSSKYPDESAFSQAISDSSGRHNAYTKPDRTVYMFSSNHEQFAGNLDIFAQFFIDPLFTPGAVGRELCAVDQEHSKNLENDAWRQFMVLKETGNPDHPGTKFATGTKKTLSIIPIETLRNWYRTYYASNRMHLVIYSNQPLESLVALTTSTFSPIAKTSTQKPTWGPFFSPLQKGHILYIEPIQNIKSITFLWEMPKEIALDYDAKPADLIAYALNNKGENSLFQSLQKDGLAEHLQAESDRWDRDLILLSLSVDLTKAGLANLDEVCKRTFKTIANLQSSSLPPYLFSECKKMADINYQWQSRTSAFTYVSDMADALVDEPLYTFPLKSASLYAYKPQTIQSVLAKMTPENTLFCVTAPSDLLKQKLDRKEKWMDVLYAVAKPDDQKLAYWTQVDADVKLGSSIPNKFIPNKLLISSQVSEKPAEIPEILSDDPFGKCYFVKDSYYLVPKATLQIGIKSPLINAQVKSVVLSHLFTRHLYRSLTPTLFAAERAGLSADFTIANLRLDLTIDGYSDKISLLTKTLFDALKGPLPTKEEFDLIKEELLTDYENQNKTLPFVQANQMLLNILYNNAPTGPELYGALTQISYEEFCLFQENVFTQTYLEGLFSGNITEEEAIALWNELEDNFSQIRYPLSEQSKVKVLTLSESDGPYVVKTTTPLQGNAAILLVEKQDTSYEGALCQKILSKAVAEAFFNTLRTKQQVAYIANTFDSVQEHNLFFFFGVQSATHPPDELLARFELFLEDFVTNFETYVSAGRFASIKQSVLISLSKSPDNLSAYTNYLNTLAFSWTKGDFTRKTKIIKAGDTLSYENFKAFSKNILSRQNRKRVAILVEGSSSTHVHLTYEQTTPTKLKPAQI